MYRIADNKLIIHDTWQMTIPQECHVNCHSQTERANRIQIMVGSQNLLEMYVADTRENQSFLQVLTIEMLKTMHEECRPLNVAKYREDSLHVQQMTGYHIEGHSFFSLVSVMTETEDSYSMMAWLPDLDDEQHEIFVDYLNENDYSGNAHPCGYRWQQSWRLVQQMLFSISPVDEEDVPEDAFRIGAEDYPLSVKNETLHELTFQMPNCLEKLYPAENACLYLYNPDGLTERQLRANADRIQFECEIFYSSTGQDDAMRPVLRENDDNFFDFKLTGLLLGLNKASAFGSVQGKQLSGSRYKYLFLDAPDADGRMVATIVASLHHGHFAMMQLKCLDSNLISPYDLAQNARNVFNSIDLSEDELRLPKATASDFQTEHLNVMTPKVKALGTSFIAWRPQHSGADFEPKSVRELLENMEADQNEAYWQIRYFLKKDRYTLDNTARKMAKVFHVPADEFNPACDREAFIHMGLISHAYKFSALRSLAWTLAEAARQQRRPINSFSFAELEQVGAHVEEKEWRCYSAMSHFPGLCDQGDYHVFYLPDRLLLESDHLEELSELLCNGRQREMESLEALRHDLAALKPVMDIICDGIGKDPEGPLADALEAWCALGVAAKEPFFSEDGQFGYALKAPGTQRPYGDFDATEEGEWDNLDDADEATDEPEESVEEDDEEEEEEDVEHAALHQQLIDVGFLTE